MSEFTEDVETEERGTITDALAEALAELSQSDDTPTEVDPPAQPFDASEINFSATAWTGYVASVQGWLRLPDALPSHDYGAFVLALESALGLADRAEVELALERPSDELLDALRQRAERSVGLQREFLSELEIDGATRRSATARWLEAWDDEPESNRDLGPVRAKTATWPISSFSSRAKRGTLNLSPSYQRGDVWPTSDSQLLIESILRGIPLPSVIILKPESEDAPQEVVDGKQRLTAILRFIGRHPEAIKAVEEAAREYNEPRLRALFSEDYVRFRRLWRNATGEVLTSTRERELYFPFKLANASRSDIGSLASLQGKYYTEIQDQKVYVVDRHETVRDIFEETTEYLIPVIEYTRATRRQIHEVFNLYNRQGKHLNAEEIRNALYHEVKLMRGMLVASGDNPHQDEVAPFLGPAWGAINELSATLTSFGFGTARYRRTKVLSWTLSILLSDLIDKGKPKRLSTSGQINALLERIADNPRDALKEDEAVRRALSLVSLAAEAHAAVPGAWAPRYRDNASGAKWQELQLVASLLGVAFACVIHGDSIFDVLEAHEAELFAYTSDPKKGRPKKTQTASQWGFIADRALAISAILGASPEKIDARLTSSFAHSPIQGLLAMIEEDFDGD